MYFGKGIALGMCRLAIVEVAAGKQPASDPNGLIHIVWNGEIYNYRELRYELEQKGVNCKTSSESEVIINLYLEYGLNFIKKLNGMFAIAIYDSRDNSLHLVRDRMGKKPLWIAELNDGSLIFASEARALMLALPNKTIRLEMISEVMQYGYINSPQSAFNEFHQLPPASVLTWRNSKSVTSTYWEPDFENKIDLSYEEALENTKHLIEEAVSRRLVSERPIGSFLSGGYDSTIVTAYMVKLMKENVKTYSIGFKSSSYNEAEYARQISKHLGTQHHEEILSPDPVVLVDKIAHILDQPFADSSIVPTYLLAQFARRDLVVALSGDGGDEVFAGYDRYIGTQILQKLNPILSTLSPALRAINLSRFLGKRLAIRTGSQLNHMPSLAVRYFSVQSLVKEDLLKALMNVPIDLDVQSKFIAQFEQYPNISALDKLVNSDFKYYLPGDILTKIDIASMANSLELRSPMLDVNVVEWGISLPNRFRIKGFETKHILKDVARSLVPGDLIDRPKMGFGIPRAEWLRTGMKEMMFDTLLDGTSKSRGWFNDKEVAKVLTDHMNGIDKDNVIWPMLMLELWARTWVD
jgi:asparagine synthase (glutamine-hydrolysing)